MNDTELFSMGLGAISILLMLILWVKLPPFLALLTVATGVAVISGMPAAKIGSAIEGSMGNTLGHIAIIISLGAMIGRMIDYSGGADAFASQLAARLGDRRVPAAIVMAAFVLGIPVFFEVGVVMLMPIAYKLARVTGRSLPTLAIPMCATLLMVHAMLPPHPGAVAVASALNVNFGRMLMLGIPVAAVTSFLVFFGCKLILRQKFAVTPEVMARIMAAAVKISPTDPDPSPQNLPAAGLIAVLIAVPIVAIMCGTLAASFAPAGSITRYLLEFLGTPYVALLLDVYLCAYLLGIRRGASHSAISAVLAGGIPDTAMIILTTGAGGVFAAMLVDSGIGAALSHVLRSTGLPILALGFVITMALRAAQGPTTVALLTTAGIMAPLLKQAAYSPNQMALVALAMGAGGMAISHVNDAGFWIVTRLIGLNVRQGLTSWTPSTTIAGFCAFALIALLWQFF